MRRLNDSRKAVRASKWMAKEYFMRAHRKAPTNSYIAVSELQEAIRLGDDAEGAYFEEALGQAERNRDPHGKHEVLLWLIDYYSRYGRTAVATELAERFASEDHDDVALLRSLGAAIYNLLGNSGLALIYLDKSIAALCSDPFVGGVLTLGSSFHQMLAIKRLQLRILAETEPRSERTLEVLNELTYLTRHTIAQDNHLTKALPLLAASGIATRDHALLFIRENSNILARPNVPQELRNQADSISALVTSLETGEDDETDKSGK